MSWLSKILGKGDQSSTESWPGDALLIDVRSPSEFQAGHVEGAVNLPLSELAASAPSRLPDKTRPLVLYCQSGMRSASAQQWLQAHGYQHLINGRSASTVAFRLQRQIVRG
ncbi:MAG: rhodanese-like domain-containing protein [Curvibacter sp.]|nr:MAG: rhodanese-like domain-containing protein [Curvibacter sp.]